MGDRTTFNVAFDAAKKVGMVIHKKCGDCGGGTHDDLYYHRLTDPSSINGYDLFVRSWTNTDNVLGTDFNIYSSLGDLEAATGAWTFCNFDGDASGPQYDVGFPRECGPSGKAADIQWHIESDFTYTYSGPLNNKCAHADGTQASVTGTSAGDANVAACKASCDAEFNCSGIEWYATAYNGNNCHINTLGKWAETGSTQRTT